jgi:mRNA-degrading endonuclease toxin of MazEF toxin-antitoxin module
VRSISTARLMKKLGKVSPQTVNSVEDRLKILLGL